MKYTVNDLREFLNTQGYEWDGSQYDTSKFGDIPRELNLTELKIVPMEDKDLSGKAFFIVDLIDGKKNVTEPCELFISDQMLMVTKLNNLEELKRTDANCSFTDSWVKFLGKAHRENLLDAIQILNEMYEFKKDTFNKILESQKKELGQIKSKLNVVEEYIGSIKEHLLSKKRDIEDLEDMVDDSKNK